MKKNGYSVVVFSLLLLLLLVAVVFALSVFHFQTGTTLYDFDNGGVFMTYWQSLHAKSYTWKENINNTHLKEKQLQLWICRWLFFFLLQIKWYFFNIWNRFFSVSVRIPFLLVVFSNEHVDHMIELWRKKDSCSIDGCFWSNF